MSNELPPLTIEEVSAAETQMWSRDYVEQSPLIWAQAYSDEQEIVDWPETDWPETPGFFAKVAALPSEYDGDDIFLFVVGVVVILLLAAGMLWATLGLYR